MARAKKEEGKELKKYRVRVHRLNVENENRDLPIIVSVLGYGRREFAPNTEVVLNEALIEALRHSVEENALIVPDGSSIYEARNPKAMAEANWPGFRAEVDQESGRITMIKNVPNYSIEVLGEA